MYIKYSIVARCIRFRGRACPVGDLSSYCYPKIKGNGKKTPRRPRYGNNMISCTCSSFPRRLGARTLSRSSCPVITRVSSVRVRFRLFAPAGVRTRYFVQKQRRSCPPPPPPPYSFVSRTMSAVNDARLHAPLGTCRISFLLRARTFGVFASDLSPR